MERLYGWEDHFYLDSEVEDKGIFLKKLNVQASTLHYICLTFHPRKDAQMPLSVCEYKNWSLDNDILE